MNQELVRIIENIARDKNIDLESLFQDLETAMVSGVRKYYGVQDAEYTIHIDRTSGEITAYMDDELLDISVMGRIAAQTVKQVMIQRIKADERGSIFAEFVQRKGEIITGAVLRKERRKKIVVGLGNRVEAELPKEEQIAGENFRPGETVRALVTEVKEGTSQVRIILSRTHPDFVRRLFELEVPEIADGIVEVRSLSREAGYRTKIAVESVDDRIDPIGACVGVRGSRIKSIVDELSGEKIDIVPWSESSQAFIINAVKPAAASEITLCFELGKAVVVVPEDQLSLAIGKHGQNVRLAARLTDWDIEILTPDEYNESVDTLNSALEHLLEDEPRLVDELIALGIISLDDLDEVGSEPLVEELNFEPGLAEKVIEAAREKLKEEFPEQAENDGQAAEQKDAQQEDEQTEQQADLQENPEE
ncbi:Transcription termination/antitermination L factor [Sedimentisphaera cyanobacteriorum]|uniref:Transcription termination/antitermination protein NusA n=1 Tax=Sedimentisphaera cyanobacteriorum TaxID=1940790 RepID=A0A1Q2HSG1_9BACT|nr:transcription termination factor NusA [Sedimentisphaera cyanobacteriorum]AQQ10196.1 Transcription termination/antitermination L factor [Sedimentisphaera cyanobacteriorum]